MTTQSTMSLTTSRGVEFTVHSRGSGEPVLWLHSATGIRDDEPMLDAIAAAGYRVLAPEWPGFGDHQTEGIVEDMLDFALHGWDVVEALGLGDTRPHLVGHSMGGMIAAEMAVLNPRALSSLTLVDSLGLWLQEHPIPDVFAMLPLDLAETLFADATAGVSFLAGGMDFGVDAALQDFLVSNARRMGTAGKIMFPIPNRRLSKRLYRLTTRTLVLWGASDHLVPPVYGETLASLIGASRLEIIDDAGHMLPYEQPAAAAAAVVAHLRA